MYIYMYMVTMERGYAKLIMSDLYSNTRPLPPATHTGACVLLRNYLAI